MDEQRRSTEALTQLRRATTQRLATQVTDVVGALRKQQRSVSVSELARLAGVSRRFLYDHPEVLAERDLLNAEVAAGRLRGVGSGDHVTLASVRADLANARADRERLRQRVQQLEGRLSEAMGAEVLADAGWVSAPVQRQLDDLKTKVLELESALATRDEALEAARLANRQLMAEANRNSRP